MVVPAPLPRVERNQTSRYRMTISAMPFPRLSVAERVFRGFALP
jgi:hypothetical protein